MTAPSTPDWHPEPLTVKVDPAHGGRWTSLRTPTREWLWTNPDPGVAAARTEVRPGQAFVDAGGLEECFPTINGSPDHGHAWSRPWAVGPDDRADPDPDHGDAGYLAVATPSGRLHRRIEVSDGAVTARYLVTGEPGTVFHHAAHALLDLSPAATWAAAGRRRTTGATDSATPVEHLGPDDGSAVGIVVEGARAVTVTDADHRLRLTWGTDRDTDSGHCSLMVWRNLRGWPATGPYRSIGIEPLIGRNSDLAVSLAEPGEVPRIGPDGTFGWWLRFAADRYARS
ncbi:hypothetical protein [Occultella glacieicola]|uniref:hypothetical protein n=1 Tax=Occultella glacieicola TaxID=2518684 RepID=UPI001A9CEAD2|nr:hypothetical protein [Occultella glacieicola]